MSNEKMAAEIVTRCTYAADKGFFISHGHMHRHFGTAAYNQTVGVLKALARCGVIQDIQTPDGDIRLAS